ncbi:phenylalanine--tRNA ligase subunit beta [Thomasclavelia cocleata]|uniref:Phenylalanine--tRNA ligase beta subunit n=1 Tax=Thomasclavelia cocleata TaxID=69824 RepID=A0A1I0I2H3_9FIRM|nr:phenylalanine--tRNA ligase subunit beta [Thomasclavelia cocleata]MCR1961972.1 phenylalanine--tRNA ligase subunit beta [Thomasclavelia cocleata]NDO40875.1 phenylalanine--tRNA ligase subunit beta [Thomasclavelia cocleata]PJN80614.1 phenylalanine--tRNA ligase subunit beta [Thomasclavelia cocleata]SET90769.1 phenylalanyl-tRNA synthetase beta subunit [Thomasclavelia cocleata]
MDISLKVLNRYVKVDDQDPEELADRITSIGLEVEGIHELAKGNNMTIGYIKECNAHPDSDHLNICQVEVKPGEIKQIVCGAPNVAKGQKVIVANPGCDFGGGFVIKESKIRGVESNGMICSIAELGLDQRLLKPEDKDGIHVLDADAPIGEDPLEYIGLKDTILEIGLTPNRSDCMALTSFAYEVAAILNRKVNLPKVTPNGIDGSEINVKVETELCSFFGAKLVKGVTTKESPAWLKNALIASGIKPINNIVDISNFVMLETGQPIHMYDYDKLDKKEFVVKTGFDCKEIMLDGEEYKIEPNDIIVSTDDGIGCIAGVMGANSTKIDENTTNIVIEAATFDGASLRETARRLNLLTDASQHYIKGALNTANSLNVLERCANLLVELADGQETYKSVTTALKIEDRHVKVSTSKVNGLLGTSITTDEIKDIFSALKFEFTANGEDFIVKVPTYRNDIALAADLIEEVARIYGYDKIPSTLPEMSMTVGKRTNVQTKRHLIRNLLKDQGLHETLTYSLTSPAMVNDFNIFHTNDTVKLAMPLGEERSVTRKSIVGSLLQVINYNQSHNIKDVNIFELSTTYSKDVELQNLAIACCGEYNGLPFKQISYKADYYLVKGFVETIFKNLGIEESRYKLVRANQDDKNYHPGRTAYIMIGKEIVGVVGNIHPLLEKKYDVKDVYIVELNLTTLLNMKTSKVKFTEIPMYPSVSRDIALVMDQDVPTYDVCRKIIQASKQLVKEAKIFDVYIGEHIEAGKKSVAINLLFQDSKGTLDEATVNNSMNKILAAVEKDFGAVLRG